jgi:hypothetical protein
MAFIYGVTPGECEIPSRRQTPKKLLGSFATFLPINALAAVDPDVETSCRLSRVSRLHSLPTARKFQERLRIRVPFV